MVYFNLGGILFYTLAFFMLQKFKIHLYVYLASIEILLDLSMMDPKTAPALD